ncbi:hypothetical protein DACRYDRAFT_60679 [Dacryopinax primogenitus]|uniref:Uncharacterized protein n=1 Tax=Dacryopinax primogenitus (strain DJM 731) TaxID=1858805 RepID=M5GFB1_DACPD|nr:uncharacterized protein DACRYDRAFT_60679 [Dacryopinax primogenitus]EJU06112.1 hypothetical protein DACRYDRAFT_60679 [Dacryopinax primogenitus]
MALLPALKPFCLGQYASPNTLELFIDYNCPYSGKLLRNGVEKTIKPLITNNGKYDGVIKLIFRLNPQPWHASTTFMHEGSVAVALAAPEHWYEFTLALYENQERWFESKAAHLTPTQIRGQIGDLAEQVVGKEKGAVVKDLLTIPGDGNRTNKVTEELKYNIKISRQNGIHVTPSACWNGLHVPTVSSSWGEKEWTEFFEQNVKL